jgi:hypothetical protein
MLRTAAADTTEVEGPETRPSSPEFDAPPNPNDPLPSTKEARHEQTTAHITPVLPSEVPP